MMHLAQIASSVSTQADTQHDGLRFWWLGQAGFLLTLGGLRVVLDAYLSDSLARKYAGTHYPHQRMMPAPIEAGDLREIDWLLCTHGHTDHMDPDTIGPLLEANPNCKVLAPAAEFNKAIERGVDSARLLGINAGQSIDLGGVNVSAVPAKHEIFKTDEQGRHLFLGYILKGGGVTVYHPGDCIPYRGQVERVAPQAVDLTLLPVNGRDSVRAANGVPGNMTLEEALDFSDQIGARAMLGHHFGMFDFNTLDPHSANECLIARAPRFDAQLAQTGFRYQLSPRSTQRKPYRILFICLGNICRSPTALGIMQTLVKKRGLDTQLELDSAALVDWNSGRPADSRAINVARSRGVDLEMHRARMITFEDFFHFDLILGMDDDNLDKLITAKPDDAKAVIGLLANYLEVGIDQQIDDPYYQNNAEFDVVYDQIQAACTALVQLLENTVRKAIS